MGWLFILVSHVSVHWESCHIDEMHHLWIRYDISDVKVTLMVPAHVELRNRKEEKILIFCHVTH